MNGEPLWNEKVTN